jgi:hypothetical protein
MVNLGNQSKKINEILIWLTALGLYGWLLLRGGYVFGGNDQIETLSYAKFLQDKTLFQNDFYIQEISKYFFNERFLFALGMAQAGTAVAWAAFGLHFLLSVVLLRGAFSWAKNFIASDFYSWVAVCIYFVGFQNINIGGNDIWYNSLIPSFLAQVIGLWAFQFAVNESFVKACFLIILAAFFQPLQGIQLFILFSSFYIYRYFSKNKIEYYKILFFFIIWSLTAGIYILKLTQQYNICSIENATLFADILEFRAAHHYFPIYFGFKNYIIVLPLLLLGGYYFFFFKNVPQSNAKYQNALLIVRITFLIVTLGIIVYCFGVQVFRSKMILSTQWFATTMWVQFFSIIAMIQWVEFFCIKYFLFQKIFNKKYLSMLFFCISGSVAFFLTTPQYRVFSQKNYDLPFELYRSEKNPNFWEIEIAHQAKSKTAKNAVFVTLTDVTYFKYFSERNHFVDYKAVVHNCEAFATWYEHIKIIYNINLNHRRQNENLTQLANQQFQLLTAKDFLQLKQYQGITHILTTVSHQLNFKIVAANKLFRVYEIK